MVIAKLASLQCRLYGVADYLGLHAQTRGLNPPALLRCIRNISGASGSGLWTFASFGDKGSFASKLGDGQGACGTTSAYLFWPASQ